MNLIVQAPAPISASHVERLRTLSLAMRAEPIHERAWRFLNAARSDDVASYCYEHGLDYAYVTPGQKLEDYGLLVMDMDSTLITIECIDEIADMQGLKPQVASITAAAMRGEIDFAESLRQRVALLAGLKETALQQIYEERLRLNPGAEAMLAALKQRGIKTLLVSGGFTFFTDRLKERLGLDYAQANTLEIRDGKLTGKILGDILDAQGKADWLVRIRDELKLHPGQVIAIGDGANDLKMMRAAGLSIAYHAKPIVRSQASHALNFVGLDGVITLFS